MKEKETDKISKYEVKKEHIVKLLKFVKEKEVQKEKKKDE